MSNPDDPVSLNELTRIAEPTFRGRVQAMQQKIVDGNVNVLTLMDGLGAPDLKRKVDGIAALRELLLQRISPEEAKGVVEDLAFAIVAIGSPTELKDFKSHPVPPGSSLAQKLLGASAPAWSEEQISEMWKSFSTRFQPPGPMVGK